MAISYWRCARGLRNYGRGAIQSEGGVINLLSEKCYGSDNFIPAFFQQTTSDAFFDSIPSLGRIIDELLFLQVENAAPVVFLVSLVY